jgi:hypothetical protein
MAEQLHLSLTLIGRAFQDHIARRSILRTSHSNQALKEKSSCLSAGLFIKK